MNLSKEASGPVKKTTAGELSVFASEGRILSRCTASMPDMDVQDFRTKYEKRYLQFIADRNSMQPFVLRSKVVLFYRRLFNSFETGF